MNNMELIEKIEDLTQLDSYARRELIKEAINVAAKIESENYKTDKLIENGLIGELDRTKEEKSKLLHRFIDILQDSKFRLLYMATLFFILMLFNSSNFWKYMGVK